MGPNVTGHKKKMKTAEPGVGRSLCFDLMRAEALIYPGNRNQMTNTDTGLVTDSRQTILE